MFKNVLLRAAAATAATALVTVGAVGPVHAAGEGKGADKASTSQGATKSKSTNKTGSDHSRGNASTQGEHDKPQPESRADKLGGGANSYDCENGPKGPYCSTRDGAASDNGEGDGAAKGRPAAGTVGKADNKNPKGQEPGPSDRNNGYECDGNNGIAKGNPAHTGCPSTDDEDADTDGPVDDTGDNAGGNNANNNGDNGDGHTPVTVCHLLGNGGYIVLTFDENALDAHVGHGDLYPVPANGCPTSAPDGGVLPEEADDAPVTDVPTTDVPTTDVPTTDVPTTDVPTTDVPVTVVPVTDVPTVELPTTDVPTTGGPNLNEVLGAEAGDNEAGDNEAVEDERDEVLGVEGEPTANRAPALAPAAGILPNTGATEVLTAVIAGFGLLAAGVVLITRRRPQDSR